MLGRAVGEWVQVHGKRAGSSGRSSCPVVHSPLPWSGSRSVRSGLSDFEGRARFGAQRGFNHLARQRRRKRLDEAVGKGAQERTAADRQACQIGGEQVTCVDGTGAPEGQGPQRRAPEGQVLQSSTLD